MYMYPTSKPDTHRDLSSDMPNDQEQHARPALERLKTNTDAVLLVDSPPSPYTPYSALITPPDVSATLPHVRDDDTSMTSRSSKEDEGKRGEMTPSLVEIMGRTGVTAQRVRHAVD